MAENPVLEKHPVTYSRLLFLVCLSVVLSATTSARSQVRFTDVTKAAGIDFVHTIGDDKMTNIVEASGVGCAVARL